MQLPPDVKQRLERKATFQAAVAELTAAVQQGHAAGGPREDVAAAEALVLRVHALLKARYSSAAAWRAGLELFQAVQASAAAPPALKLKLPGFITDARAFVTEGLEAGSEEQAPPRQQTLGELLLGLPPPAPAQSHLSDAGLVLDHASAITAAAAGGGGERQQQQEQEGDAQQRETGSDGSGGEQEMSVLEVLRRLQEQRQQQSASTADGTTADGAAAGAAGEGADGAEAAGAPGGGADGGGNAALPGPGSLEALQQELLHSNRAELEAMLISLVEQHTAGQAGGGSNRPAASKAAVARLPVVTLDSAAALESVGGPSTACPVCTEDYSANGGKVQRLPCKHVFHVDCLAPWLQQDNSCPVCRQELPTDDHQYESRKEREAQEAEDRRGAANALSHNEFMWI